MTGTDDPTLAATSLDYCRARITDIEAQRTEPLPASSIDAAAGLAARWIAAAELLDVTRDDLDLVTSVYYAAVDAVRARDRRKAAR